MPRARMTASGDSRPNAGPVLGAHPRVPEGRRRVVDAPQRRVDADHLRQPREPVRAVRGGRGRRLAPPGADRGAADVAGQGLLVGERQPPGVGDPEEGAQAAPSATRSAGGRRHNRRVPNGTAPSRAAPGAAWRAVPSGAGPSRRRPRRSAPTPPAGRRARPRLTRGGAHRAASCSAPRRLSRCTSRCASRRASRPPQGGRRSRRRGTARDDDRRGVADRRSAAHTFSGGRRKVRPQPRPPPPHSHSAVRGRTARARAPPGRTA